MKVLSIVGARPQFIKAAVVSKQLRASGFDELLLHSGQHYDFNMSEVFFRELDLPAPSHYLGIGSGRHGEQTGAMLSAIEDVLLEEEPDMVVIYGDTNTTLAGALASAKLHIPVAHVEAGLRSYNRRMPEEINRVAADHCSDVLFCPTETAVTNLRKEGFANVVASGKLLPEGAGPTADAGPLVVNVGDVMLDVARSARDLLGADGRGTEAVLEKYELEPGGYVLATIHRASNTDDPGNLRRIFEAMHQLGRHVFFPVHPRTRKAMDEHDLLDMPSTGQLTLAEPVSYLEMVALESQARLILTDSGGVQKEAYFHGVPCVVAREETEWTELIEAGWNRVAGTKTASIVAAVGALLEENLADKPRPDFYGDGHAAERIATVLGRYR
jgi:UDP-N-acetylglucosamine 2-epimerase